ncbi:hypothetical protein [Thermodesulfobacterium sp.]|jgi:hypothetical protein|uniref:hypothetical protein n=1 Tax=Thermodesulfobacterium sp. TaxID=1965289 RepID=UPI00257C5F43|nr:hypothetical protein [Thermodesulfobacterium sp.]MBZ4682334.1 hypothetical protein [Thermodesulfobacterium sp.]
MWKLKKIVIFLIAFLFLPPFSWGEENSSHFKKFKKEERTTKEQDISFQRELNVEFLNYYKDKYRLTDYEAFVEIQKKLALEPEKMEIEGKKFIVFYVCKSSLTEKFKEKYGEITQEQRELIKKYCMERAEQDWQEVKLQIWKKP